MGRIFPARSRWFLRLLAVAVAALNCSAPFASAATLFGTVGLTDDSGRFTPGQMIRIYLVSEKIPFGYTDDPQLNRFERIVRTNNAHLDFFLKYREKAAQTGYLKTVAESSMAGTFTIPGVAAGRYWVLVTFPSMIDGRKAAWQVPVDIPENAPVWIHLTSENLLIPALSR